MALQVATGHNDLSANDFIKTLYSTEYLKKFYPGTITMDITNMDYVGEITKVGDEVKIPQTPTVTINDGEIGGKYEYEHLNAVSTNFVIDKFKTYSFHIDGTEDFQSHLDLAGDQVTAAGKDMAVAIDQTFLADVYSDAHASNQGASAGKNSGAYNLGAVGSPLQLTSTNIVDFIIDMGSVLDEQDVPPEDRWLALPPVLANLIKKNELSEVQVSGDSETMKRHGYLGVIDRFKIYQTNNLKSGTDAGQTAWEIMAGQMSAITFASQIVDTKIMEDKDFDGKFYRGKHVYGYKVLKPEALVWGHVYR
jgi:hypothetical protein